MSFNINIQTIEGTDVIGDSVDTFNNNFDQIDSFLTILSASVTKSLQPDIGITSPVYGVSGINVVTTFTGVVSARQSYFPPWHNGSLNNYGVTNYFQYINHINTPFPNTELVTDTGAVLNTPLRGGTLLPDGRVFCTTPDGISSFIYDSRTNKSTTAVALGINSKGGGILLPNGKVLIVPSSGSSAPVCFDPVSLLATATWNPLSPPLTVDWSKYSSYTLLFNNKVFISPNSPNIPCIIYDYTTNTFTQGMKFNRSSRSCVLLPDGRVYRIPSNNENIAELYSYDLSAPVQSNAYYPITTNSFYLGQVLLDGRVFIAPNDPSCGGAKIYNPIDDTLTSTTTVNFFTGSTTTDYYGAITLLPDGRVLLLPLNSGASAIIYNLETNTTIKLSSITGTYTGAINLYNGSILCLPTSTKNAKILRTSYDTNFTPAALTSPFFNKTF